MGSATRTELSATAIRGGSSHIHPPALRPGTRHGPRPSPWAGVTTLRTMA
jgi:hypothetical protein